MELMGATRSWLCVPEHFSNTHMHARVSYLASRNDFQIVGKLTPLDVDDSIKKLKLRSTDSVPSQYGFSHR
jgi:hypothetical protein